MTPSPLQSCSLKYAAIELSLLLSIEWDAVSAVEAVFDDEDFWQPGCEWAHLGAASKYYWLSSRHFNYGLPRQCYIVNNTTLLIPPVVMLPI